MSVSLNDLDGKLVLLGSNQRIISFEEVGGKWNVGMQAWIFPAFYFVIDEIFRKYPDVEIKSPLAQEMMQEKNGFPVEILDIEHKYYNRLYDYQKEAVSTLLAHPYQRMMLALSPGLGKTPTSIVAAQLITPEPTAILVICPLILMKSWKKEFERWSDFTVETAHKSVPSGNTTVTITNYETIVRQEKAYTRFWSVVIIDESIMVKNYRQGSPVSSQRAKAVAEVAKKGIYVWELTGGPISNHAGDLFGQFRIMFPSVFRSYWKFVTPICEIARDVYSTAGRYGGQVIATKPDVDIRNRYKDVYFVRSMAEVAPEIPDYIYQDVPLELSGKQLKSYNQALAGVLKNFTTGETLDTIFNKLTEMIRLQQAVSNPANFGGDDESVKRDYIVQSIQNNSYEFPMLIFAHWRYTITSLYEHLTKEFPELKIAYIIGGMQDSQSIAEKFENGKLDILILSLQAGKYGLNFPLTKTVIMHDRIWDADAMYQATFRARRRTTKHSPVWVSLYIEKSIDSYVRDVLETKLKSIENVTGTDILAILSERN